MNASFGKLKTIPMKKTLLLLSVAALFAFSSCNKALKEDLEDLQAQVDAQNATLNSQTNQLNETNNELNETTNQLNETNADLLIVLKALMIDSPMEISFSIENDASPAVTESFTGNFYLIGDPKDDCFIADITGDGTNYYIEIEKSDDLDDERYVSLEFNYNAVTNTVSNGEARFRTYQPEFNNGFYFDAYIDQEDANVTFTVNSFDYAAGTIDVTVTFSGTENTSNSYGNPATGSFRYKGRLFQKYKYDPNNCFDC